MDVTVVSEKTMSAQTLRGASLVVVRTAGKLVAVTYESAGGLVITTHRAEPDFAAVCADLGVKE